MDYSFRFLSIYLQTKQRMYGNVLSLTNIQICYCIKTQLKNNRMKLHARISNKKQF